MSTLTRAAFLTAVALAAAGCKGEPPPGGRDAGPVTAVVPAPPVPSVDAAPAYFDAHEDAAAVPAAVAEPPKVARKTPVSPRPSKGGSGVGAVQVTGNQPKAAVEAHVRGRVGALLACYADRRKQHPDQHGRLYLKVTMNDRGVVELAEVVKSTISDDEGQACVVEVLRRFKFPPPPGGGASSVTFQLGI